LFFLIRAFDGRMIVLVPASQVIQLLQTMEMSNIGIHPYLQHCNIFQRLGVLYRRFQYKDDRIFSAMHWFTYKLIFLLW
jgi:hypothetical protein